jgi:hypothetical protein
MVTGGYIVFDEYEWTPTYPGAGKAINEFLLDKPESIQRCPELGGNSARHFIVKGSDSEIQYSNRSRLASA